MPAAGQPPQLLKDQAYKEIKTKILDGTYPPGTFLSERKEAELLNMSKTPVKAAFERLTEQGLVYTSPQRGVIVRQITLKEMFDHYDFRIALESFAVRQICGHLNENILAELEDLLTQQQAAIDAGDNHGYAQLDNDFHQVLIQATGNQIMISAIQQETDRMRLVLDTLMHGKRGRTIVSIKDHHKLVSLLKAGAADEAVILITKHLGSSKRELVLGDQIPPWQFENI